VWCRGKIPAEWVLHPSHSRFGSKFKFTPEAGVIPPGEMATIKARACAAAPWGAAALPALLHPCSAVLLSLLLGLASAGISAMHCSPLQPLALAHVIVQPPLALVVMQVSLQSGLLGEFAETFHCNLRGSTSTIPLTIKGAIVGPQATLDHDTLDFGMVAFGFRWEQAGVGAFEA
jgi:hypothetical protein